MSPYSDGGYHVLCTLTGVRADILSSSEALKIPLDRLVEELDFHVIKESHHQFMPHGATCVYLLSESHLSAHTFVEAGKIVMDIFCCSPGFHPGLCGTHHPVGLSRSDDC